VLRAAKEVSQWRPTKRPRPSAGSDESVVSLKEAARLSSLSVDSWKRHHRDKLIDLGPRRLGVRKRDALFKQS